MIDFLPEKKPSTELRQIRDALSEIEGRTVSQEILARRLETSTSLINAIEAGARPISEKLARRILHCFGVWTSPLPPALAAEIDAPPIPRTPYAPFAPSGTGDLVEGIRHWMKKDPRNAPAPINVPPAYIARHVQALLEAAVEGGQGAAVSTALDEAILRLTVDFQLQDGFIKQLVQHEKEWPDRWDNELLRAMGSFYAATLAAPGDDAAGAGPSTAAPAPRSTPAPTASAWTGPASPAAERQARAAEILEEQARRRTAHQRRREAVRGLQRPAG